jgi:signal transduction histidine kinase
MDNASGQVAAPGGPAPGRYRLRVLGRVLLVNLAGGLLIFFYFSVIDVSSLQRLRFIRSWETLIIMAMIPALLAVLLSRSYAKPLFEYLRVVSRPGFEPLDETNGGGRIIHVRRRALRFPAFCAIASLLSWAAVGLIIAARIWSTGRSLALDESLSMAVSAGEAGDLISEGLFRSGSAFRKQWMFLVQSTKGIGLSMLVGGMVSAVLFFMVESVWQRELPRFFPGARITKVVDPWIIPVRYRLIAIFVLVGTVPLIMIGVLSYQRASAMVYMRPEEVLGNLLLFNLFTVLVGVGLAALLAGYVAKSVSEPLERLREGIERVGEGDLAVDVAVRANDELGRVTEGFNDMVRSLADKEASIMELTHGLEEKVKERTRELTEALEEKERTQAQLVQSEKMAGLGQLVAGVAHEINNPVGYIYANSDHLERYLAKLKESFESGDDEAFDNIVAKMEKVIQSTREGSKRTKEIVSGLRTFSRKEPSLRKPVDVREPIETALMLVGHELKMGIEVIKDYGSTPRVKANPGEVSQVFMNVIVNAVQSMGETGTLKIETRSRGGMVIARIADTGKGIDPEHLQHLFEPFFTTKDVGEGTGLGLSITYGIVKAHGGDLKVESEPGRGATVEISFPAADKNE